LGQRRTHRTGHHKAGHDEGVDDDGLVPVDDVSVGGWIAGRLDPFGGQVSSVAPRGFEAYASVHPAPAAHDAGSFSIG
jgi:hypothetical protein